MRKERNSGREITIREEVKVPGTDVILEKGDRVSVSGRKRKLNERFDFDRFLEDMVDSIQDWNGPYELALDLGGYFSKAVADSGFLTERNTERKIIEAFSKGLNQGSDEWEIL